MYNNFALLYDELMDDIDYKNWYLYIEKYLINLIKNLKQY